MLNSSSLLGDMDLIFRARGGFMSLDVIIERISLSDSYFCTSLFLTLVKYTPHRMAGLH